MPSVQESEMGRKAGEEMRTWRKEAKRRWGGKAVWIDGDGQFAVLAWCRVLTVSLWPTMVQAEKSKQFIDELACGGYCTRNHEIVDLGNNNILEKPK